MRLTRNNLFFLALILLSSFFLLQTSSLFALGVKNNEKEIRLDDPDISIRYDEEKAYISHTFTYLKGDVVFASTVILGRKKKGGEMARLTFQYQPVINLSTTDFNQKQEHTIVWSLPAKEFEYYKSKKLDFFIRNLNPIKLTAEHLKAIREWKSPEKTVSNAAE